MADLTVRTYDPSKVSIVFGAATLTGFSDGTFVKIKRSGDVFEKKRGADGTVDRIAKSVGDFEVEVTLKQTSPLNAILSGILASDMKSNDGILNLSVTDLSGASLFAASQAWIRKDPDTDYADSLGSRTWTFDTGAGANLVGGN